MPHGKEHNFLDGKVSSWMADHGFKLAAEERKRTGAIYEEASAQISLLLIHVREENVQIKGTVTYLGMMLDMKLTFWTQIRKPAAKAACMTMALSRTVVNTSVPKLSKHQLLMSVMHSSLLYSCLLYTSRCV